MTIGVTQAIGTFKMTISWIILIIMAGFILITKAAEWWMINITCTRYKFDGNGNIVRTNKQGVCYGKTNKHKSKKT